MVQVLLKRLQNRLQGYTLYTIITFGFGSHSTVASRAKLKQFDSNADLVTQIKAIEAGFQRAFPHPMLFL